MRRAFAALLAGLVLAGAPASGQVLRVTKVDPMTDKRQVHLVAPSVDGKTILGLLCGEGIGLKSDAWRYRVPAVRKVLARVDGDAPAEIASQAVAGGQLALKPADPGLLLARLSAASRLVLRIDGEQAGSGPTDIAFDFVHDNRHAFALAAELAGAPPGIAETGYNFLELTLADVAAGRDRQQVDQLMKVLKIEWRDKGRPRDPSLLIGAILSALPRTFNSRTLEDAGQVLFGYAWPQLRPLAQRGPFYYGDLNRNLFDQLQWLKTACAG